MLRVYCKYYTCKKASTVKLLYFTVHQCRKTKFETRQKRRKVVTDNYKITDNYTPFAKKV